MTTVLPVYKAEIYAPRSIDPSETTVLTPISGAPHSDLFRVATIPIAAGDWKPYLHIPEIGRRGIVDVRHKTVDTGVMYFDLLDPVLPGGDPLARWFPAFLGNVQGQIRSGGLLFRSWESLDGAVTFTPFYTGRVRTIEQRTPIRYRLGIRELTDDLQALAFVGQPHPDAYYATFGSLLPVVGLSIPEIDRGVVSSSVANPTVIAMLDDHHYVTGDRVSIRGHSGSTPDLNADWTITVTGATTFTVPANVTVAGSGGAASKYVPGETKPYGNFPVVKPLIGVVQPWAQSVFLGVRRVLLDSFSRRRGSNVHTENLMAAAHYAPGEVFVAQGAPGHALARVRALGPWGSGHFHAWLTTERIDAEDSNAGEHRHVTQIGLSELQPSEWGYTPLAFYPIGVSVEITIVPDPDTSASETFPLFIGDVHPVTLWRHLLEGKFGFRWQYPEVLPPGVAYGDPRLPMAYDTAKFAALEADQAFPPVRFPVTQREPRGQVIEKDILEVTNLSFYLDGEGKVVPIDLRRSALVAAVPTAPTITDADLAQGAPKEWQYDRGQAVTRVDTTYYRDVHSITVPELNVDPATFPTLRGGGIMEIEQKITVLDVGNGDLGDAPLSLDLRGLRAMAGEKLNGQERRIYLERYLVGLALDTALPFGHGAPTMVLSCARGGPGDGQLGDIRKISIRSIPDPATNRLGGTRIVRILQRHERQAWVDITVMDLGLTTTAGVPTLGVPVIEPGNSTSGVVVPVTLNGAGDPVEVHYAVTDTGVGSAPAAGSPLWTPIPTGLVRATGDVAFRGLPTGQRIWVEGRSYPDAKTSYQLPSAWVAASSPGYVDLFALSAPVSPSGSLQTSRSFRVSWFLTANILLSSEDLRTAGEGNPITAWTVEATTLTADATLAPDGILSADKLIETAVNAAHTRAQVGTIVAGNSVVISGFFKPAERTQGFIYAQNGGDWIGAEFDTAGGGSLVTSVGGAGSVSGAAILNVGGGWWYVWASGIVNAGSTSINSRFGLRKAGAAGYLGTVGEGAYYWGTMFEQGTTPSNYIRTTTGAGLEPYNPRDIEILIATPTTDPRVVVARLAGGSTYFDFPGQTGLVLQPSTTYRVGIRHVTVAPVSVSAEITVDVTTAAGGTDPVIDLPHPPRLFW